MRDTKGQGVFTMGKGMRHAIAWAIFLLAGVPAVRAQQPPAEGRDPNAPSAPQPIWRCPPVRTERKQKKPARPPSPFVFKEHRFWDRENDWLFAGVGAGRTLDYASTLNLRRRGIDEVFLTNSIVDNHPLFVGIEAAATAASDRSFLHFPSHRASSAGALDFGDSCGQSRWAARFATTR